jgi:hypothetical protein
MKLSSGSCPVVLRRYSGVSSYGFIAIMLVGYVFYLMVRRRKPETRGRDGVQRERWFRRYIKVYAFSFPLYDDTVSLRETM